MSVLMVITAIMLAGGPQPDRMWPAFLGQGATAIDASTIPKSWSPQENIAWTAKLPGKGQSSPVIWGNRVFVTSIDGSMKDQCQITAIDLASGHPQWSKAFPASQTVRTNYFQSRSASTPVVDIERIYAFFETGNLIALTHTGELAWQRSITEEFGLIESNIGLAASPLLIEDTVVLLVDHEGPSYLLAVDTKTGTTKWKTDRDSRKSYASPTLVTFGTSRYIVCSSDGSIDGYDPATGNRIWTFSDVGGNTSSTPLQFAAGQFLVGATPGMHNEREKLARQSNFCMKLEDTPEGVKPKIHWRTEKAMPSFGSPVVFRDHAYWVTSQGVVFCFDVKTGEQRYAQRTRQAVWITPVGIGDQLYLFGKDGLTTVLASGPEFKIIAENQLWDPDKLGRDAFGRQHERGPQASTHGDGNRAAKPVPKEPGVTQQSQSTITTSTDRPPAATQPSENAGSRPPLTEKERAEARSRGEDRFADPIQYGVALVNGSIVIRTGEAVYCVRMLQKQP